MLNPIDSPGVRCDGSDAGVAVAVAVAAVFAFAARLSAQSRLFAGVARALWRMAQDRPMLM